MLAPRDQGFLVLLALSLGPERSCFHCLLGAKAPRGHREEGLGVTYYDEVRIRGRALSGLHPLPFLAVSNPHVESLAVYTQLVGTGTAARRPPAEGRPHCYRGPARPQVVLCTRRVQEPRPPPREGHDHRLERTPKLRKHVDVRPPWRRQGSAPDDPLPLKPLEPGRKEVGSDPRQPLQKILETLGSRREFAHQEQRPPLAHHIERPGYRAVLAVAPLLAHLQPVLLLDLNTYFCCIYLTII